METEFFLLKLEDIEKLANDAFNFTDDSVAKHYVKLLLEEVEGTRKALLGE